MDVGRDDVGWMDVGRDDVGWMDVGRDDVGWMDGWMLNAIFHKQFLYIPSI